MSGAVTRHRDRPAKPSSAHTDINGRGPTRIAPARTTSVRRNIFRGTTMMLIVAEPPDTPNASFIAQRADFWERPRRFMRPEAVIFNSGSRAPVSMQAGSGRFRTIR